MPSTSAPPSACHQPQLLDPPSSPSLPPATPLSLLPLLSLPSLSAVTFSSFTVITANPNAFLLRDAVAKSSANFVAAAVSLSPSSSLHAVADDKRVLTALTLLRCHRPCLRLHQPSGPYFPTGRRSHRPRPLPSPLFPSRCRRGQATSAFFPCFLMASSPPSSLHPCPASSAASFDVVLCYRHGLEVAVSLHWSLLRMRTLPLSLPPSLPSTLLSPTPVALKNSKFYGKLN